MSYNAAKAALIRATACLQSELDVDGLNGIHMYALHPGANKTGLQGYPSSMIADLQGKLRPTWPRPTPASHMHSANSVSFSSVVRVFADKLVSTLRVERAKMC